MKRLMNSLGPILLVLLLAFTPTVVGASSPYLSQFNTLSVVASTVPANGDVNPYGIVVVPASVGSLVQGDVLVSNFNNSANLQGTGSTIVEIAPSGSVKLFAHLTRQNLHGSCPGGVGLTTALVALRSGWVVVGSLPTRDGTAATAKAGCLIVLNSRGTAVETFSGGPINGPWDMTALDEGDEALLFVTNVLNGTVAASPNVVDRGTVLRIQLNVSDAGMPRIDSEKIIGSGFPERTDPNALVIGPTGVALGSNGTLYVADTLQSRIAAIPNAVERESTVVGGNTISQGGSLNGPLGLTLAPNGDLVTANGGDGNLVEITPSGTQPATKTVEPGGGGTLFGLTIVPGGNGVYFVDDGTNQLGLLGP
jgi:hypothetical protein